MDIYPCAGATPTTIDELLETLPITTRPIVLQRSIGFLQFKLIDGDGDALGGSENLETSNVTISVANVNVAPVIGEFDGGSITFTENDTQHCWIHLQLH